jgi:hypothetical protein
VTKGGSCRFAMVARLNVFVQRPDERHEKSDDEQSGRVDLGAIRLCACVCALRRVRREVGKDESDGERTDNISDA